MTRTFCALAFALFTAAMTAHAEVRLHGLFQDGAVLQQKQAIPVWGTAGEGEKVTVSFLGQKVSTVAKNGKWFVRLKPVKAGGPYIMTVQGENTITLRNLLVGEVWLCSGQSNMAFQLYRAENAQEAINAAADPQLRFFQVPHESDDQPRTDVVGTWMESTPKTASNFSAVAYFYGRDLRKALNVPVGLIDSSVGGTPAEAWTPKDALESSPVLQAILDRHNESVRNYEEDQASGKLAEKLARRQAAVRKAKSEGKPAPRAAAELSDPAKNNKRPSGLYNAMIAPLQPYAIAGAIWYQGEGNSGRAEEYITLFPTMISSWRKAWNQGEFPFFFVQIAPHERMSPEIREAQLMTWRGSKEAGLAKGVPRTAMVVTTDIGDEKDIHPKAKEPVGARLALAARAIAYGERIPYSGPVCTSARRKGNTVVLSFDHVNGGLEAKGGVIKGFEVAGSDGTFAKAEAKIDGNKVVVTSLNVPEPVAARYGWERVPEVNLFNKAGLPATPFRINLKQ